MENRKKLSFLSLMLVSLGMVSSIEAYTYTIYNKSTLPDDDFTLTAYWIAHEEPLKLSNGSVTFDTPSAICLVNVDLSYKGSDKKTGLPLQNRCFSDTFYIVLNREGKPVLSFTDTGLGALIPPTASAAIPDTARQYTKIW